MKLSLITSLCAALVVAGAGSVARAQTTSAATAPERVEMFAAIAAGQIAVKFIPRNANDANLMIENKTKRPLTVELPEVFAATPVLGQFGFEAGAGQGVGGGAAGAGNPFNIPPEATRRVRAMTLCLEHGKPDPRPWMEYEIKPIDSFVGQPAVVELVRDYAGGKYPTKAAQAAAWHLANDMSWQQLAAKRVKRLGSSDTPYFTGGELAIAVRMAEQATERAKLSQTDGYSVNSSYSSGE